MDFTFGWGEFLGEIADIIGTKLARKHADQYSRLEKECLEEWLKPYGERDDVKFVRLRKELELAREAYRRDLKARDIDE